jgi:hypothetical protein
VSDAASANYSLLISRERSANAIRHGLRLFVGRGRRYSVKELSNATGVKDRVIECAMCEPESVDWRALPTEALLSLACFLGADFTNTWIGLAQQGAFDLPEGEPDPGELAADNADDNAKITRAAADRQFDGEEVPELGKVGRRMIRRGMSLVAFEGKAVARG